MPPLFLFSPHSPNPASRAPRPLRSEDKKEKEGQIFDRTYGNMRGKGGLAMILVTIKHRGGKRPDFENYDFSTMKKAVEWLRENGFAPA